MRALQLDPVTLSEVRRQRARAIFGRTDGRFAPVDRESNAFRLTSEADFRLAASSPTARNNYSATLSSKDIVSIALKDNADKASAIRSVMKLRLAQLESEFEGVACVSGCASGTHERDPSDLGARSPTDARIRDTILSFVDAERMAASAAADTSAMVKSDVPAEHPGLTSEGGQGQHFPGSFPCGDTTRQFLATVDGRRDSCGVRESRQTHDACCRFCNHVCPVVHYGVVCDACKTTIRGHRFRCMSCTDYDLCNACKLMGRHSYHNFECISYPTPAVVGAHISGVSDFRENQITEEERHHYTELRSAVSLQSQEELRVVHNNVWCDLCHRVITGPRFKCGNCDDFDLCSDCETKADHDHDHVFLKIRRPMAVKSVTLLFAPQNASIIRQKPNLVQTVWTETSNDVDPAFVEGSMEDSPSLHHKGTETMPLQKCDRATTMEQSEMATSGTQTTLSLSDDQEADIQVKTLKFAETATPSAPTQLPYDCFQQNRPNADFRVVESSVGGATDDVKKSDIQQDAIAGALTVLIDDAPGEAEVVPASLPDYTASHDDLDSGMGQVTNGRHLAVVDASEAGRDDGIPSIVSSDIDDEFVMVSASEDASKALVAGPAESEPSNREVNEMTLTGCSFLSRVAQSLERVDAYEVRSTGSRALASTTSTCTNAAILAGNQYSDADATQTRLDDVSQPKHFDGAL